VTRALDSPVLSSQISHLPYSLSGVSVDRKGCRAEAAAECEPGVENCAQPSKMSRVRPEFRIGCRRMSDPVVPPTNSIADWCRGLSAPQAIGQVGESGLKPEEN